MKNKFNIQESTNQKLRNSQIDVRPMQGERTSEMKLLSPIDESIGIDIPERPSATQGVSRPKMNPQEKENSDDKTQENSDKTQGQN
jgi:hypothetical protein